MIYVQKMKLLKIPLHLVCQYDLPIYFKYQSVEYKGIEQCNL